MAENFRQGDDGDDDENGREERHDVVGENESLPGARRHTLWPWRCGLRAGRWSIATNRRFGLWRRKLGSGDGGNGREGNGQGRNGGRRRSLSRRRGRLSRSGCRRGRVETCADVGSGPTAFRVADESVTRDLKERLRKRIRHKRIGLTIRRQSGRALRERFDKGDAERPDVGGGRERRSGGLGSVVNVSSAAGFG